MRVVAVMNQKGGVGKTTTTCNLGAALARNGKRVLLIDLDPQAHLSLHLDHDVQSERPTIDDVMVGGTALEAAVEKTQTENLFLVPSHIDLASAELELAGEIGRETVLRSALGELEKKRRFDVVLIDCPPSLGLLSLNGLCAAEEVLIPLQAEFFALHGISRLIDVMEKLRRRLKHGPDLLGIVLCRMQTTTRLAREVEEEARRHFGARVFQTAVRQNVRLAEASSHGQTVFEYDASSQGAKDYEALALELLAVWEPAPSAAAASAAASATATSAGNARRRTANGEAPAPQAPPSSQQTPSPPPVTTNPSPSVAPSLPPSSPPSSPPAQAAAAPSAADPGAAASAAASPASPSKSRPRPR